MKNLKKLTRRQRIGLSKLGYKAECYRFVKMNEDGEHIFYNTETNQLTEPIKL